MSGPPDGAAHRPAAGHVVPTSTYRLQIRPEFTFGDAAETVGYLDALGVSHVYLSPVLQPTPGSTHGYDVVDHSRLNTAAGGLEGFEALVSRLRAAGMGVVLDVVPNHMAVPTPAHLNAALWSVLRDGPASPFASWFDIDWDSGDHALLMPVLGARIGTVLGSGQLSVDTTGAEAVLRYGEQVFPVRPGTESLPVAELVDRQWYRLAHWRVADEELNYRRFFDIDTLAAVRVEDPAVFDATHALLLDLVGRGLVDGLRIDHPDGLADPGGYLRRVADRTGGAWVVVEKVLAGDETLPSEWACSGTTGYDALMRVGGLFVDPSGGAPLQALMTELTGEPADVHDAQEDAKREAVEHVLYAEVHRLVDLLAAVCHSDVRLRDHTRRAFHDVVVELLVAIDRYRAYVVPGEPPAPEQVGVLDRAVERARQHLDPDRGETLDLVRDLLLGREVGSAGRVDSRTRAELVVRFQQTCGPVLAKGVEDTVFYRWLRLASLNEVGGDPARFGVSPEEFHAFAERLARDWPATMTTLTTHDTKRAEDARAQLAVLSEVPTTWAEAVDGWRAGAAGYRHPLVDEATEYLVWQTLVATWAEHQSGPSGATMGKTGGPIGAGRLREYLTKAVRESRRHTTWTAPQPAYESAVLDFAAAVLADPAVTASVGAFVSTHRPVTRAVVLGQKLVQLTMPGVPDVYQGAELLDRSLVDPDNRRPVDYRARAARLARLDAGARPADLDDEKLLVTACALRLRREHPEAFTGPTASYAALPTSSGHAVAFTRGSSAGPGCVTLATRLPVTLHRFGGWGEHTVTLPDRPWRDLLTGRTVPGGSVRLAQVLTELPVALLTAS